MWRKSRRRHWYFASLPNPPVTQTRANATIYLHEENRMATAVRSSNAGASPNRLDYFWLSVNHTIG